MSSVSIVPTSQSEQKGNLQSFTSSYTGNKFAPVVGGKNEVIGKEEEREKVVMPVRVFGKGITIYLSWKEKVICDTFLRTRSISECVKVLKGSGVDVSRHVVEKWMGREHVRAYLSEKFDESGISNGWTKEHWLAVMNGHLDGSKRLKGGDLYAMKLIGDSKGFFEGDKGTSVVNQINFTQINGKA